MKHATTIVAVVWLMWFGTAQAERPVRCVGTFSVVRNPVIVNMNNLRAAAAKAEANGGCPNQIEVIALVDDSLSPKELTQYGWRVVTRIGEVATLSGCAESAPYLSALPGIRHVKMPSRVHATMDSVRKIVHIDEVHKTVPGWTGQRRTGKGVLFGIIDTDFDTRHKAFLDSNGLTRFTALWDQFASPADANRYGYGVIKNHTEILADSLFGLGTNGHGTYMASFGAGSDWSSPYYGVAPDAAIAAVKTRYDDAGIIDGLDWLFFLADSLSVPCVVNMSIGMPDGPHDGTSLVDRAIDDLSNTPGHIVVGAAGNDGNKKAHIAFQVRRNQSQSTWVKRALEMWGEAGKTFSVTFSILDTAKMVVYQQVGVPYSTDTTAQFDPELITIYDTMANRTYYLYLTVRTERAHPFNNRPCLYANTSYELGGIGYLGVTVSTADDTGCTVHAWSIDRSAFKSFQISGCYDGDSLMSVNEIGGTAKRNITVGAYNSKLVYTFYDGRPGGYPPGDSGFHGLCAYSGRGSTVDGRVKPDITAPGSNVAGAMPRFITDLSNCVYWPDSPSVEGRYAVTGGTSVSAPIVAGVVALMLEVNPTLTVEQVRTYLQETAITDEATGPITVPNNLWGAGKVNALGVVSKMLNVVQTIQRSTTSLYRLIRLPGNQLRLTGPVQSSVGDLVFEYFSINGRCYRRDLLVKGISVDSFNSLPRGVYIARVSTEDRAICQIKIALIDKY